jgi:hypothetical protein
MKNLGALLLVFILACGPGPAIAGPALPGPAQSQSQLAGCLYTSGGAVLTSTNNQASIACDASGNLKITGSGYEFNASVIPTVQNASYAAGQSLGGLQTISIGSTNSITGVLSQIQLASKGGSVVASVVYVWQKNPASTTCTDKTNFVASQTDDQQLIVAPQLLTPALSVSAQDTSTRASVTNLAAPFVNGSTNTNLYVCVLANATVTPGTTTDLRLNISGTKDQP